MQWLPARAQPDPQGPEPRALLGNPGGLVERHDELHSLFKHIDANSIRFWMGFGDHYINVFTVLRKLRLRLDDSIPLIGVGGILSGADAAGKIVAGAQLVQFYTGMIYRGPELVHRGEGRDVAEVGVERGVAVTRRFSTPSIFATSPSAWASTAAPAPTSPAWSYASPCVSGTLAYPITT